MSRRFQQTTIEPSKESIDANFSRPRRDTVTTKAFKQLVPELVEKSEDHKIKRSVIFSSLAQRKSLWENKTTAFKEKQSMNVFSGQYDKAKDEKIDPNQYGKAPEGSRTEERAKEASLWVDNEISKLTAVIKQIGKMDKAEGGITVDFGTLFDTYVDISDTLVGILMRAKKRNVLKYEGQMLYQGASKNVKITLL